MTDNSFDTVSVALVGDLSQLLSDIEKAVTETEQAGEKAGELFSRAMTEALGKAGDVVRQVVDQIGGSFEDAAAKLQGQGFFEAFSTDQLAAAASVLDSFGVELGAVGEELKNNADLQKSLAKQLTSGTVPALQKEADISKEIRAVYEEYSDVLGEDVKASMETYLKLLEDLEDSNTEQVISNEELLGGLKEKAALLRLEEREVRRLVTAYQELGMAIPDAVERDKLRKRIRQYSELEDSFSDVEAEAKNFTDSLIAQAQAHKDNQGALGQVNNFLSQFGINLGGLLPKIIKGTAALGAMKLVFDEIRKATKFALELTDNTDQLAAAFRINALAGDQNTKSFKEWYAIAEQVQDITGDPLRNSIEAVADTLREMGASTELTDQQIEQLTLRGAEFSKQYGGKLPQSLNQLSAFINTGLSDSLRKLGLDLDKSEQNRKAFELGLGTNIDKLDENNKRLVRYSLLMEELEAKTATGGDEVKSFADRLDDVSVRSERASKKLGDLFVPIAVKFKEVGVSIKEGFVTLIETILSYVHQRLASFFGQILGMVATAKFIIDNFGKKGVVTLKSVGEAFTQAAAQAEMELLAYQTDQATGGLDDYATAAQNAADATEDLGDAIAATAEQIEGFIDAARKFDEGMKKIEQNFLDRMDAITLEFAQRRADLETDFLRDLRDIDANAADDRLQAIRDYQVDEIRLREDHALDIRQLEERYLLDLEDAVRNRDARGVLNLQRRFNLEKKQREEDFRLKNKRLKEDFNLELQEIEYQRQRRRQERYVAYQEELLDFDLQEQRKREAARLAREQQERDLLESIKNRLLALQSGADGEVAIEQEKLDALVAALNATYGPDGPWVLWHQAAVETVQTAASAINDAQGEIINSLWRTEGAIRAHVRFQEEAARRIADAYRTYSVQSIQSLAGASVGQSLQGTRRQRGGSFVATGPQSMTVGEGRPERVDITPLSGGTGRPSAGFRGGDNERIGIDLNVDASEMLIVEVADQTMNEIADVMVNVNSRNYQGGRGA